MQFAAAQTQKLPALNPMVKIYPGENNREGAPEWTLHHPVSNRYFQIGWMEFECLARFHRYKTADELLKAVNEETTLEVDEDDIQNFIAFLGGNGLLSGADSLSMITPENKKQSVWMKILHSYLFFTIPLFKPQAFLDKTISFVRPFLSQAFLSLSYALLVIMVMLTLQRPDEFLHTFFQLFSVEGAITLALVFAGIKVLHELGHAYTATKYNVPVPHMGIAFIVMYPILYTETTGAWQVSSRKKRIHIGLAGIATELVIAAYALLLWHILPPGLGQSLAFSAVAISLIGSLLINLNPLMRFDGYYVLSDALGIENLHSRAIAFARWKVREILFALGDPRPEDMEEGRARFLTAFGFAVIIYRFFLFLGIALLVYHIFFQPLGLLLMTVELALFIGLPIWKEVTVWYERRNELFSNTRTYVGAGIMGAALVLACLPIQTTVSFPAIYHASSYGSVYPPSSSLIAELHVTEGKKVEEGDLLAVLESPSLEKQISVAKMELETLQNLKRREQTNPDIYRERRAGIEQEITAAEENLKSLHQKQNRLLIKADFDGIIRDMPAGLHEGRFIKNNQLLFRLIEPDKQAVTAYAREDQLERFKESASGRFLPGFSPFADMKVTVEKIAPANSKVISWPELSSVYAGPIPSEIGPENEINPRQSLYAVRLSVSDDKNMLENQSLVVPGQVTLQARPISPFVLFLRRTGALFIRESGLGQ